MAVARRSAFMGGTLKMSRAAHQQCPPGFAAGVTVAPACCDQHVIEVKT